MVFRSLHQVTVEAVHCFQVIVGILQFQFINSIQGTQVLGQYLYLSMELFSAFCSGIKGWKSYW